MVDEAVGDVVDEAVGDVVGDMVAVLDAAGEPDGDGSPPVWPTWMPAPDPQAETQRPRALVTATAVSTLRARPVELIITTRPFVPDRGFGDGPR